MTQIKFWEEEMDRTVSLLEGPRLGFRGISIAGDPKIFLWWKNVAAGETTEAVQAFCALFLLEGIEVQIGPAINEEQSLAAGEVVQITGMGLYVEKAHREQIGSVLAELRRVGVPSFTVRLGQISWQMSILPGDDNAAV